MDEQQYSNHKQGSPTCNDKVVILFLSTDNLNEDTDKPLVGIGVDYKAEHQQSLSQVIGPNTQTITFTSTEPLKRKYLSIQVGEGETAQDAANKDVLIVSVPIALPPEK